MTQAAAILFVAGCVAFAAGVVLTLHLTRMATGRARGRLWERLKLDAAWPMSVLADKPWHHAAERRIARAARWLFASAFVGLGVAALMFYSM